jgi:hypothetical protein
MVLQLFLLQMQEELVQLIGTQLLKLQQLQQFQEMDILLIQLQVQLQ